MHSIYIYISFGQHFASWCYDWILSHRTMSRCQDILKKIRGWLANLTGMTADFWGPPLKSVKHVGFVESCLLHAINIWRPCLHLFFVIIFSLEVCALTLRSNVTKGHPMASVCSIAIFDDRRVITTLHLFIPRCIPKMFFQENLQKAWIWIVAAGFL